MKLGPAVLSNALVFHLFKKLGLKMDAIEVTLSGYWLDQFQVELPTPASVVEIRSY